MEKISESQIRYRIEKAKLTPLRMPKLPPACWKKVCEEKTKSLKEGRRISP